MNKNKNKVAVITLPALCDYTFHVELTDDFKLALASYDYTRKLSIDTGPDGFAVHVKDRAFTFIFLPHNASPGTIAHEAWHGIERLMAWIGAEHEDEIIAYHLGYLVDKICDLQRGVPCVAAKR